MIFKNLELFENYLKLKGYEKQVPDAIGHSNALVMEVVCYTKDSDEVSVMANIGDESFHCIHSVADDYIEL